MPMAAEAGRPPDGSARLEAENARLRERLAATQHRVRNTLAVIRSLARRSAETSETVEAYATHLDGRIGAFARIQGALLRDPGEGLGLGSLVADSLLSVLAREGRRARIEGPEVALKARAAETLGLALHELATNAVKFGALGWPRGRIAVTWEVVRYRDTQGGEPRLVLDWVETGAPAPVACARQGFGMQLLERTLAYEFGARTTVAFNPEGLACRIDLPFETVCLPEDRAPPEDAAGRD